MASSEGDVNFPEELIGTVVNFEEDFRKMSEIIGPLSELNINSTDHKIEPLDRARLNLVCGFALNSLFWMYLKTIGVDPKEHKIKGELERYKEYFTQIKEIDDEEKAPKLDPSIAKRFVHSALWAPAGSVTARASTSKEQEETVVQKKSVQEKHERELSPSRKRFKNKKVRH